ncbi:sigma-70 family RNA polymerase sigma factor [uncultured Polaribacter sp.]|uniref:sigma-70 family RNA polymerase sigma factor n=1 Tax=uncultured Polaribacter sp. TaxID=174711 RepID=UPI002608BB7A|nr:sigma-70 family RNA polymerase sigma factor [uncultured Polaribacter sp.]
MQHSIISDSTLVSNYINGEERALEILITRHKQKIFGFIYSKVGDKFLTEDIFQDTFIKVIRTLKHGNYNEEGKFLPWVMRIAHNLVIDHYRKSSRIPKFNRTDEFDIFSVLGDDSGNMETKMIQSQLYSQITHIIKDLPKDQREVLTMRIYNELSFKEISENTGVSINTVLGRMRYALINMRKLVAKNEIILTD